jgi:hypothetical protein
MLKKNLIILFLLSLYTTVLVHNAIPHHHHSETVTSHAHHVHHSADKDHDHHHSDHEKDHGKTQDDDDNKNPFLALHLLIGHSEQVFLNQSNVEITTKIKVVTSHIPVAYHIVFPIKIPDPDAPGNPPVPDQLKDSHESYSGLRAPPALA